MSLTRRFVLFTIDLYRPFIGTSTECTDEYSPQSGQEARANSGTLPRS